MTITSALLITVGAILRWAVTAHASWIDLHTAGLVLFVIGLVGLAFAVAHTFWWPPRRGAGPADVGLTQRYRLVGAWLSAGA